MEWHITDAQSLAIIDNEIGEHSLSPAEYEIVRQVIYATADFEYKNLDSIQKARGNYPQQSKIYYP